MNYVAPAFQPIQFIPTSQKDTILNSHVTHVTAVAHERLETGGNHWCFYLAIDGPNSVKLDMVPSYTVSSTNTRGGSKGILILSSLDNEISTFATKEVKLDVRNDLKVAHFVSLLEGNKRHQYEFNDQGQGCRFWTDDQVLLFQRSGYVTDPAQVAETRAAIRTQYPDQTQYPLGVGEYYS